MYYNDDTDRLINVIAEYAKRDQRFAREMSQAIAKKKENRIWKLVQGAVRAIYGAVIGTVVHRVVRWLLGAPW